MLAAQGCNPSSLLQSCRHLRSQVGDPNTLDIRTSSQGHLNDGKAIEEDSNPHDVANLLKQFLRELPDPLLSYELYDGFIQVTVYKITWPTLGCRILSSLLPI